MLGVVPQLSIVAIDWGVDDAEDTIRSQQSCLSFILFSTKRTQELQCFKPPHFYCLCYFDYFEHSQ